jgi:NADH-quinone oxidoreductase subunit L
VFYKFFDKELIDGIVNGVGSGVKAAGSSIRYLQNGNIGFYLMSMVLSVVLIVLLTFLIK